MYEENKRKTSSEAKVMPGSSRNPWGPHSKRGQKSRTAQTAQPPTQKQFYSRGNHHRRWTSAQGPNPYACQSWPVSSFFLSFFLFLLFCFFPVFSWSCGYFVLYPPAMRRDHSNPFLSTWTHDMGERRCVHSFPSIGVVLPLDRDMLYGA